MSRASTPATPAEDLSKHRGDPGVVLSSDLAAFLQSGVSVIIAARDPGRRPLAGIALACTVDAGGAVRVFLREPANVALLRAIAEGSGVAVTFSRPIDHRSIQIKGTSARMVETAASDLVEIERQCQNFRNELVDVGYTPDFADTYLAFAADEVAALAFTPEAAFVQTPGPGAGTALRP